jgi:hypothetical protein
MKLKLAAVFVLVCLVATAGMCFLAASQVSAQQRDLAGQKDGYGNDARIFVKGAYAYVVDIGITHPNPLYTNCWVRIYDISDFSDVSQCCSLYVRSARDVFVAGDYMYVVYDSVYTNLAKYDISDPCDPDWVASAISYSGGLWSTDLCVNDDKAYVSRDCDYVLVFDVSGETVGYETSWYHPSPQGIHVRGGYAYIDEESGLWVRDIAEEADYIATGGSSSRDVFNVAFRGTSIVYETAYSYLRVWDVTDPTSPAVAGSLGTAGPLCYGVVHANGDWVYRLGSGVQVYPVEYGDPDLHTSYSPPANLQDIHEIHECYWRGPISPMYGQAHIFGVYEGAGEDSNTVKIWIYSPSWRTQTVRAYKYGDVDEDGDVDLTDALLIDYYTADGCNGVIDNLDAADVNCDGEVNTYDRDYLFDYLYNSGPIPGADCDFYHDDW